MNDKTISAKIVADSINSNGNRLTTMLITFPRIILPEVNTHRMLSKNTASSRAIPFERKMKEVKENPFIPLAFQKHHKGMQGSEYMDYEHGKSWWLSARDAALIEADASYDAGMTKQLANRILEPFTWTTMLISGTEWENFFALRVHPDAEIHMQALATEMLNAMNSSKPNKLDICEWHIPFGDKIDISLVRKALENGITFPEGFNHHLIRTDDLLKAWVSCARAARLSYETFEGEINYQKDLELAFRLSESGHWSAFEHTAEATSIPEFIGNFNGWIQFRKMFKTENRSDSRLIKDN